MTVVPGGGHTWCTPSPEISLGMSAGVARRGYWNTRVSLTRSPQPRAPAVGSRRLGTHGHVEVRRVRVRAGVALGHPLIPARPETPSEDDVGRGEVVCGSDDDRPRLDPRAVMSRACTLPWSSGLWSLSRCRCASSPIHPSDDRSRCGHRSLTSALRVRRAGTRMGSGDDTRTPSHDTPSE